MKKTLKNAKKSVDKLSMVCYSNKADAAEGAGGASKEARCTLKIKHCKNTKHYVL